MTLDSAMLACAIFAETTLLVVLAQRRVGRWLPWFCGYIAWCLVSDIAGWAATSSSSAFCGQFYFFEAIIDSVLQFAVLLELAMLTPAACSRASMACWSPPPSHTCSTVVADEVRPAASSA